MNYVLTRRLHGSNCSDVTLEAGSPISFADMERLGYGSRQAAAWAMMIEDGEIVPVGSGVAPLGTAPPAAPVADLGDEQRGGPAALTPWSPFDMGATRDALEASAEFDRRKEAERRAGAETRAGAGRTPAMPARPVIAGREWVRP